MYIDKPYCELYYGNDTICVSFDVKDIPLVPYAVNGVKGLLHISIARPMTASHNVSPYLEREKGIGVCLSKLFQSLFCEDSHRVLLALKHHNLLS